MAKHKRLEPLSPDELTDLLDNNPSKKGLERILRFDLDKVTAHLDLPGESIPFSAPAADTSMGDLPVSDLPASDTPSGRSPMGDTLARGKASQGRVDGAEPTPMGESPVGDTLARGKASQGRVHGAEPAPMGESPVGMLADTQAGFTQSLVSERPMGKSPLGRHADLLSEPPTGQKRMGYLPTGNSPMGQPPKVLLPTIPYMEVEGRGKRPLRYCRTVQDGHTSTEQLAYQTIWAYAKKAGRAETNGAQIVDLSLRQLCSFLGSDHKQVKRIMEALADKLAIEVVRQPDFRLAHPTRYRVYNYTQILERRRAAGLVWVVRTRAVRFVSLDAVNALLDEMPVGGSPMGEWIQDGDLPAGEQPQTPVGDSPETPTGQPSAPILIRNLNTGIPEGTPPSTETATAPRVIANAIIREFGFVDDDAIRTLIRKCREIAADATDEEIAELGAMQARRIRQMKNLDNPVGLLITQAARCFKGEPLAIYRREKAQQARRLEEMLGGVG